MTFAQGPNDRDTRKRLKQRSGNEGEYDLSRYKPLLRTVLEVRYRCSLSSLLFKEVIQDHVNGRLDQQAFPYVKDSPPNSTASPSLRSSLASPTTPKSGSLRSAKPSWHKAASKTGPAGGSRQRVLVFVAGGMTCSEMREVYLLSKSLDKDIIIGEYPSDQSRHFEIKLKIAGSTHTITPTHFMEDMRSLELAGVGSRAIPKGLRSGSGQRSFQEFYDERYPTLDQAPPKPQPQQQPPEKKSNKNVLTRPHVPSLISFSSSNGTGTAGEKKKKRFF